MSSPTGSSQWFAASAAGDFYDFEVANSLLLAGGGALEWTNNEANTAYWTFSCWIKRAKLAGNYNVVLGSTNYAGTYTLDIVGFDGSPVDEFLALQFSNASGVSKVVNSAADEVFQDLNAWYHYHVTNNNGTRVVTINGKQIASWTQSGTYLRLGGNLLHNIGAYGGSSRSYNNNYNIAEVFWISDASFDNADNYAYTQFAEFKEGILVPKENSLNAAALGDAGFYLEFKGTGDNADASGVGADTGGGGHHVAIAGSIPATHRARPDTPTNNFCIINTNFIGYYGNNNPTMSEGGLEGEASGNACYLVGSMAVNQIAKNGGCYFEIRCDALDTSRTYMGLFGDTGVFPMSAANAAAYQWPMKVMLNSDMRVDTDTGVDAGVRIDLTAQGALANGDVVGVAINSDGKVFFSKNGTFLDNGDGNTGNPSNGDNPMTTIDLDTFQWMPTAGYNSDYTLNFGQDGSFVGAETSGGNSDENGIGDFMFAVPTGHLAMCTKNLPEPVIGPNSSAGNSTEHFKSVLYTGDGSVQAVAGVGHKPDLVWIKNLDTTDTHLFTDSARGVAKQISPQLASAEAANADAVTAFGSDGFTVGDDVAYNTDDESYISYNWRANGGIATATISESGNNPAAVVQANQEAGFSLITYVGTGATGTIAHGLGAVPKSIWIKNRDEDDNWACWHGEQVVGEMLNADNYLIFNSTGANVDNANWWNDTAPTSSVFTVKSDHSVNANGENYVAYVFAPVDGFSSFGSYKANNVSDGPYIYCEFRPAFILLKNTGAAANWEISGGANVLSNPANKHLFPNITSAESTSDAYGIYANGFKILSTGYSRNRNSQHYVYYAWADQPFKYANAR